MLTNELIIAIAMHQTTLFFIAKKDIILRK